MRHCISSTELLFEKAMQRVYQTMQMEEAAENAAKRRSASIAHQSQERLSSVKRKLSFTNGNDALSRRNSFRRRLSDEGQQQPATQTQSSANTADAQPKTNASIDQCEPKKVADQEKHKIIDTPEPQEEERDLKKEIIDAQRRISLYRHQTPPSSLEFADDYTDSTASSASSLDSLEKFIATVKTMSNDKANDDDELETYHPRMAALSSTFIDDTTTITTNSTYKNTGFNEIEKRDQTKTPATLQQPESSNSSSNSHESVKERSRALSPYRQPDSDQSTVELNKPHPLPDPDFVPKPILKRPVSPDPISQVTPEQIPVVAVEKEKSNKSERKGIMQFFTSKKSSSSNSLTASQDKLKTNQSAESLTKSQQARKSMIERRQSSIEENKVVVDHYSDIVKEVSSTHKPPKTSIYLSGSIAIDEDRADASDSSNAASSKKENSSDGSGKPNKTSTGTLSSDKTNVLKSTKPNESYSRSIFAIKLSKDPKKAPITGAEVKPLKVEETQSSIDKEETTPYKSSAMQTSAGRPVEELPENNIEKTRSRPTEARTAATKRKPSKSRERSSSAVRSKPQVGKEKIVGEQSSTMASVKAEPAPRQTKRLRSESKSPATKNRKALLTQTKTVIFKAAVDSRLSPSPRCQTPEELLEETQTKVKSTMNYITDVAIFCVACWVYMFKDARLALPIIALMVYRQLIAALKEKCPKWMKWKRD